MPLRADRPLNLAPATALDYRELARRRLPRQLFDYVDGGAYEEATMRANVTDLARVLLRQVVMRDVSARSAALELWGQRLALPVILGPVGLGGMLARRGEVQAARAAEAAGVPFVLSTVSVCSLAEVAGAARPPWFQLYVMRERGWAEELLGQARAAGCPVLILTVDLPVVGARHRDTRNGVLGERSAVVKGRRALDLLAHPRWLVDVALRGRPLTFGNLTRGGRAPSVLRTWIPEFDPSVTWADIAWVRDRWEGPLLVKGVLDGEDARRALDAGVDGVIVSNHGGRQLDSVPSTARALPQVCEVVAERVPVLVDGGVRNGLDVVKLLALGARAVLIGRAWAWALAARGEAGVRHVLQSIGADIDVALALTGCTSLGELGGSVLYRAARELGVSR